ncbi:hypothetical protein [Nocardia crassostreae]|uniref:hypothetical protein n=1 Tax=Nocardia crassostreae TaxID=53428 RepID=UPI0008339AC5|nr:hypothetical protein [Nocardia crassostreae]
MLADAPELDWYRSLRNLEQRAARAATVPEIAESVRRALANPETIPEVSALLTGYAGKSDPADTDKLLSLLVGGTANGRGCADAVVSKVLEALLSGACGATAALEFRRHVRARSTWYAELAQRCSVAESALSGDVIA